MHEDPNCGGLHETVASRHGERDGDEMWNGGGDDEQWNTSWNPKVRGSGFGHIRVKVSRGYAAAGRLATARSAPGRIGDNG